MYIKNISALFFNCLISSIHGQPLISLLLLILHCFFVLVNFIKQRAALGWFAHQPEWYDLRNKYFAQSEAQSVLVFVHHLSNEKVDSTHLDLKARGLENGSSTNDTVRLLYRL